MEDSGSVLSLVSQGKHVCLLTVLKIQVLNSLSFVKAGGYLDGRDTGALEAHGQQRTCPRKGPLERSSLCKGALVTQTELQDMWSQHFLVALLCF